MYNCKICNKIFDKTLGFARHVSQAHKMKSQEYYDYYLKKIEDGLCVECGNPTRFDTIERGYIKTCSPQCACTMHRRNLKNNLIKFNKFREKVIINQSKIWETREINGEKDIIREKISSTLFLNSNKLSQEERNKKFGYWKNKHGDSKVLAAAEKRKIWILTHRDEWKNAHQRRRYTMIKNGQILDKFDPIYNDFKMYTKKCRALSWYNYQKYKDEINPNNLTLSRYTYHLDHKYSIFEGFKNNIPIEIISNKNNLAILLAKENLSKHINCSISKEDLYGY